MKENFERHLIMIEKEIESAKEKLSDLMFAMNGGYKGKMFKSMKTNRKFNFGGGNSVENSVIDEAKEFSLSDSSSFGDS
jgi:hypothetical protein